MKLFPKDELFYELFQKQADKLVEASKLMNSIIENPDSLDEVAVKLKHIEHEADGVAYSIMEHLSKSFMTPLEGEDIVMLRHLLDNIMDYIERAVNRMSIYKIKKPLPEAIAKYISIITSAIEDINIGIGEINNIRKFGDSLKKRCYRLNAFENQGDELNRTTLRTLMNNGSSSPDQTLEIMKMKEIYETLENAIDACEDVGNVFEAIVIKNI